MVFWCKPVCILYYKNFAIFSGASRVIQGMLCLWPDKKILTDESRIFGIFLGWTLGLLRTDILLNKILWRNANFF
jgi:hypothetical protein